MADSSFVTFILAVYISHGSPPARGHRSIPKSTDKRAYLKELDESQTMLKWGQILPDLDHNHQTLKLDETGLGKLLEYVHTDGTQRFTYALSEKDYMLLESVGALSMAVDLSLRLDAHNDEVRDLISIITKDVDGNSQSVAKSRSAWRLLKEGVLEQEKSKAENQAEFEHLRNVLHERLEKGVQRPFRSHTMPDLVQLLDKNTISHDDDHDGTDEFEELQQQVFRGNRSILHEPASPAAIASLEECLGVRLPGDNTEFLQTSNGLKGIWNGYLRQRLLGSIEKVWLAENIWGDSTLPLQLVEWNELPFTVDWPELGLDHPYLSITLPTN